MKPTHVALAVIAVVATIAAAVFAGLYFTKDSGSESAAAEQCGDRTFGHISSLTRKDDLYEMRFDPAWFTSGVTANVAAAEDGVVEPGEPVPNDNYRIEEGHRLLTYLVPADAHVTVLTRQGDPAGFRCDPDHRRRAGAARGRAEPGRAVRAARHAGVDPGERRHGLRARPAVPAVTGPAGTEANAYRDCAIQAARSSRSASVIPVAFPGGIACVSTAWRSMSSMRASISSRVSSRTPSGAETPE